MFVSPTREGGTAKEIITAPQKPQGSEFSRILNKQITNSVQSADVPAPAQRLQPGNKTSIAQRDPLLCAISRHAPSVSSKESDALAQDPQKPELLLLGTLSKSNPTVSDLMIKHPAYGKDCWNIVYSDINRHKDYTAIPNGSRIYLNPGTLEIQWKQQAVPGNETQTANNASKDVEPVFLGTISENAPTVSDLMIKHPAYGKDCWNIVYSDINRHKDYTAIPNGSRIYLNPGTLEIQWSGNRNVATHIRQGDPPALQPEYAQSGDSDPFSARLAEAVKPYIGKSYKEMNCFELVVQGMEELGIRYYGRGGLGEQLVKTATENGLEINHYLSGEGLIETSGSRIYAKSFPKIRNSKTEALKLYQEVKPLLREGMILSFSTPTRGHTGIISRREQDWTYINSGRMDHPVEGRPSKGVGEEFLNAEIRNWFRLAADRTEPLQITIGRLAEDKLQGFLKGEQAFVAGIPISRPQPQKAPHSI